MVEPERPNGLVAGLEVREQAPGVVEAGEEITLRLEYTVESYAFADLYVEATTSRDAPRWYGIGRSQRLPHGSGTVTMTGTVDAPESGWVEVQVSMYAPYPCGFVTLSRVSKFRYVVQGQGTSVGTQPSLVSSRQNCESAAAVGVQLPGDEPGVGFAVGVVALGVREDELRVSRHQLEGIGTPVS